MNEHDIISMIEPVYRWCRRRIADVHDAEDLASEILCHALEGMKKYDVTSPRAWIWRIARNRYARYIDAGSRRREVTLTADPAELEEAFLLVDEDAVQTEYEDVFRCLHTLAADYRELFVDHYLGGMPVRTLAGKYGLTETTVKWRLNVGRTKIRERIGAENMEKIYRRIHWNTTTCNGSCDPDAYLHTQLARAICEAAYEAPRTVEELSLATGIPTLYIEDELPRLLYGEALARVGRGYAADFIILRRADRSRLEAAIAPHVARSADVLAASLAAAAPTAAAMEFPGHDFGMARLGHLAVPYLLRASIRRARESSPALQYGSFPPRKDGGNGWFIVEETDETERAHPYASGCNIAGADSGSAHPDGGQMYYYWTERYFDARIYHGRGIRWVCAQGIVPASAGGILPEGLLSEDDRASLTANGLLDGARLNFAIFTKEEFDAFTAAFPWDAAQDGAIASMLHTIRREFDAFVPARLEGQIAQWVSCFANTLTGYVTEELIRRGILRRPDRLPFTDGVCFVGKE